MTEPGFTEVELRHWLVDYLVTTIGCNPNEIDMDVTLFDLGVGSRDAVVLSGELSELLGRPVSPIDFWQNPTINTLAAFLVAPESEPGLVAVTGAVTGTVDDRIAVVGLGCRLPGAAAGNIAGPEALWQFLSEGGSAISEVPADRWLPFDDGSPETAAALARTTRWGGFLADLDAFDSEFFDISPSEADRIDPQQRLLLEVAWEALEHAGIPAESLRRSKTGVFAGACVSEYGYLASSDLSQVDAWTGTGGALSIIANRLSYFLDLHGPSVTVDTACSSSLVAVHLACQSLRTGDSDVAMAAGVNLVLSPAITRSFDQAQAMSPTGACRTFDASADGFVRGEGCGVVVLKRFADAVRDNDRVLAVVRGSAVNQDGRSNGLMAPNPSAQVAVLRAACANAGVDPREVDYVEAHGTGTLLGDPIEARALATVFGRGRPPTAPLLIGSVKSNLGHLEAAAGIAGFIKATLALQRGRIPGNLHFNEPNPHIAFDNMRLKVVAGHTDWPTSPRPRRAGVSGFGFGGTNAHVVLEQGPDVAGSVGPAVDAGSDDDAAVTVVGSPVTTLVVAGKSPERVSSQAAVMAAWMQGAGSSVGLADVAHTLNHHRARGVKFGSVVARDREGAVAGLEALAAGSSGVGVVAPHAGMCGPGLVFVYSGQGSQWAGMGARLLVDEPAFAAAVAELEPVFVAEVGFSLLGVLAGGESVVGIERIQPVLVGVQLALTALWRSYGVEPDALIGHSMGEVTAAVVSGALSVAQGLRVIATRSRLMSRLSGQGAMALVELDAASVEELTAEFPGVTLAVYASRRQSVIAGPPDLVDAFCAQVAAGDRLARRVDVDVASHHPTVDPILDELRAALAGLLPRAPRIPLLSTTSGHDVGVPAVFDAEYWVDNLRNPVRFCQAVATAGENHGTFIEVSPHPLLTYAISDTLSPAHHHSIATLERDTDETLMFHTHRNAAHTTHPPHTEHLPEPHVPIPTTAWHHTRHWVKKSSRSKAAGLTPRPGTLLGDRVALSSAPPVHLWRARLVPEAKPYPGCHRIRGIEIVPMSVLLNTMLTAAAELGVSELTDVAFAHPVIVDRELAIQVVADGESVWIASSSDPDAPAHRWTRHVTAQLAQYDNPTGHDDGAHLGFGHDETDLRDLPSLPELFAQWGIEGPPYSWTVASYRSTVDRILASVELSEPSTVELLDAAAHVSPLLNPAIGSQDSALMIPAGIGSVRLTGQITDRTGSVSVTRTACGDGEMVVDVSVSGFDGAPAVLIDSLRYVSLDGAPAETRTDHADPRRFVHRIDWKPAPVRTVDAEAVPVGDAVLAVVGGDGVANQTMRTALTAAGYRQGPVADADYVIYVACTGPGAPASEESDVDNAARTIAEIVSLADQLADRAENHPARLWIVTRGVREALGPDAVRQSPLWGLAGVLGAEHPELWGGLVDIAAPADIGEVATALSTIIGTQGDSILALRDGVFHAPALEAVTAEPVRGELRCRADAAYLITGGLGALGLLMAGWLADLGGRRLILVGRTPLPPRREWDSAAAGADTVLGTKISAIRALESRGVSVEVVALDISSAEAVSALLHRRDLDGSPEIRGVIHAAGVTRNALLRALSEEQLRQVLVPKIGGAQVLHEAFPPGALDFLFLTASAGSVFGLPGQGSYAAANSYLDALARERSGAGDRTVSLDWVAWRGLGFASDAALVVEELRRMGSRELTPDEAFAAWEYVHTLDIAQTVVLPVSTASDEQHGAAGRRTLVAMRDWSQMPAAAIRAELESGLRRILARELRLSEAEVESDRPFAELGLNSMMAMSIRNDAEQLVGIELSATMLWNHPTVSALAAYLAKQVALQEKSVIATTPLLSEESSGVLDSLFDSIESASLNNETAP